MDIQPTPSTLQNTAISLHEVSKGKILQRIRAEIGAARRLPLPSSFKNDIELSMGVRNIIQVSQDSFSQRKLLARFRNLLARAIPCCKPIEQGNNSIKLNKLLQEKILPYISELAMLAGLKGEEFYAVKYDEAHPMYYNNDIELQKYGNLIIIISYITSNANNNSTFSHKVAEILLNSYLDPKPNIISLIDRYPQLIFFADRLDASELTDQQKITVFKQLISYIKSMNAEAAAEIDAKDISDRSIQASRSELSMRFNITGHRMIDEFMTLDLTETADMIYERCTDLYNQVTTRL